MYWLALTLCIAAADGGEVCSSRLWPMPLPSLHKCELAAALIMQVDPAYRLPRLCTLKRPDLPLMPGPIPPGQFA